MVVLTIIILLGINFLGHLMSMAYWCVSYEELGMKFPVEDAIIMTIFNSFAGFMGVVLVLFNGWKYRKHGFKLWI